MFMRSIFSAILQGAAITLGSTLITKGFEVLKNPVKKANLKRKIKNVKDAINS